MLLIAITAGRAGFTELQCEICCGFKDSATRHGIMSMRRDEMI